MPGTTPENNRGIPKRTTIRRKRDFKKVDITFELESFSESCLDIVTTYSFCFETSAEKTTRTKIYRMENCL